MSRPAELLKRAARSARVYQERELLLASFHPGKRALRRSVLFLYKPYYPDHQLHSWVIYLRRHFRNVRLLPLTNEQCPRMNPALKTPMLLQQASNFRPEVVLSYESLITSEEADHLKHGGAAIGVCTSGVHSYYRGGEPTQAAAINTLRKYDWYVVSHPPHVDVLRQQAIKACALPFSAETSWFFPMPVDKTMEILFVGDFSTPLNAGREDLWQRLAKDFPVAVVSNRDPRIPGCTYLGYSEDPRRVNRWLNEAKIVLGSDLLGDTAELNNLPGQFLCYDDEYFVRQRTMIALSAGSCYCVERHKAVADLFKEDEEIVLYDGIDDLTSKVRMLLAEPKRAAAIGRMGRARVVREHATEVRLGQLGEMMGFL